MPRFCSTRNNVRKDDRTPPCLSAGIHCRMHSRRWSPIALPPRRLAVPGCAGCDGWPRQAPVVSIAALQAVILLHAAACSSARHYIRRSIRRVCLAVARLRNRLLDGSEFRHSKDRFGAGRRLWHYYLWRGGWHVGRCNAAATLQSAARPPRRAGTTRLAAAARLWPCRTHRGNGAAYGAVHPGGDMVPARFLIWYHFAAVCCRMPRRIFPRRCPAGPPYMWH